MKLTLQLAAPVAGSEHEADVLKSPPRSDENATAPVGREPEPESLSDTVAVHVVCVPSVADAGVHDSEVAVARLFPVAGVTSLLDACVASPLYDAVICAGPAIDGVKLTAHFVVPLVTSVHAPLELKSPPLSLAKDTAPDGAEAVPAPASDTVAVQVVCVPTVADAGAHDRTVAVARVCPVTALESPLPVCVGSPA